jgi:hypothetical protein
VIVCVPPTEGVYVTEQVPVVCPVPPSVHDPALNEPEPELVKVTVPVGRSVPVPDASETVAVQVLATPALTVEGEQLTEVVLLRLLTVRAKVPELVLWVVEPPYEAVIVSVDPPDVSAAL